MFDGGQSAGREQRHQLRGHWPVGSRHRDHYRQVEERENRSDGAVRGQRKLRSRRHRHDKRVLRWHGCPIQRPILGRVECVGRPAGYCGRRRHRDLRRGQRSSDRRCRRRRHARRPRRSAGD